MGRFTLLLAAALVFGLSGAVYFGLIQVETLTSFAKGAQENKAAPPYRSEPPVQVTVARAETEDVPLYLNAIGTVQASKTVNVKTRVDGEIQKILFEEGQDVKEGDPLVVIDPRPYDATLRQWQATLQKDKAQVEEAERDLNRYQGLFKTKAITEQQLDQQRALVEVGWAQVDSDRAQIDFAKVQLEYATLRAPITGRAGIRQIDQGNIVHAADNTTIVVLTQLQPISVIFTVPSRAAAQDGLTIGKVRIPVVALGADNFTQLDQGTLDLVDNIVDQTTGTVKLKANFPNADLKLWPGDFVNGRITVNVHRDGLTVPSAAVRHGPQGDYVWVLRNDQTVEARAIGTGRLAHGRTLIARGVRRGELVITDGHFLLTNGRRVEAAGSNVGSIPSRPQTAAELP
jgi:membrane fusion protein, multidrug efflux system